ncbi:MAG: MlaD family protein [Aeromicrobium sp.]|uniref:MCE family protein n=1 Tax=Aeromicrobium sp. TaxID=1871063 RepID=UPI0039E54D72
MKKLPLRLVVAALALVAVFVITSVYVYQGFLGGSIAKRPTEVTAELSETGGLFERSSVTYRGVKVGSVTEIRTTEDGVEAVLALDPGVEVPASSKAVVRNLSPAGEQFIDLQPKDSSGPSFKDGDKIKLADTTTPTTVAESLRAIDTLMAQVEPEDLRVTLDELSTAFADPDDLSNIVDSGQQILDTLDANWPQTERVITNSQTVLQMGVDLGPQLQTLAPAAKSLTEWLVAYDPRARELLAQTPAQVEELRTFTSKVGLKLPDMLNSMGQFTDMTLPYRPHLWEFLDKVPGGFSQFAGTINGGYLNAVMFVEPNFDAEVCAYVADTSPDAHQVASDSDPLIDTSRTCSSESSSIQQRGSAHAPGPVPLEVALQ